MPYKGEAFINPFLISSLGWGFRPMGVVGGVPPNKREAFISFSYFISRLGAAHGVVGVEPLGVVGVEPLNKKGYSFFFSYNLFKSLGWAQPTGL